MRKKERQQGKEEQLRLFKSTEVTYRPTTKESSREVLHLRTFVFIPKLLLF